MLITTGPADDASGASNRVFYVSPDGSRVLFATAERLFADLPRGDYLYERSGGTTKVISGPPIAGGAPVCDIGQPYENEYCSYLNKVAGDKIFYTTTGRLVAEDTDSNYDSYVYSGGVNRLVGGTNACFSGASSDGTRAFVTTPDPLLPADTDTLNDVYENHDGTLSLVTYDPSADPWGTSTIAPAVRGRRRRGRLLHHVGGSRGRARREHEPVRGPGRRPDRLPTSKALRRSEVSLVPAYRSCLRPRTAPTARRSHGRPALRRPRRRAC